jgi:hypothetical protein
MNDLDLDDFADVDTAVVFLKHPQTLAPTTASITLAGREHPSRKRIDLDRTRKLRQVFFKTGKLPSSDPSEDHEDETVYLVASTLGWTLTKGGKSLPFSPAAARELYTDPTKGWVRDQVLEAMRNGDLFIKACATN